MVASLNKKGTALDPTYHHYIRLERIHVNSKPEENAVTFDGTVESMEYYGLYIKYTIKLAEQTVKVIEKNDGSTPYNVGDKVTINFLPANIMSYPPKAEEA